MSAYKIQMLENYPEESIQHVLTCWDIWVYAGRQTRELMQGKKFEDQQVKWKKQHIKKCHYQFFGTSYSKKLS